MDYNNLHYEYTKGRLASNVKFILLHGWGHTLNNLKPIANELSEYDCYLIDLPGFGDSPTPDKVLSVSDYANIIKNFILNKLSSDNKVYIIGHSLGGRIALYLASLYPDIIDGIFIVSGAGLKKHKKLKDQIIIKSAKLLKSFYKLLGLDIMKSRLYKAYYNKFASSDYKNASPMMKKVLKAVVKENLSSIAKKISVPTILIYGENDITTPVFFGKKYNKFIKDSKLYILPTYNHTNILTDGKYQVSSIILNHIKD